ncbi:MULTISPECIES: DUF2508 family protein [unclassified Paenibacillus]|uniref:DUF2508 family protein n=1 Tax=unclassified Paenibacillus TaxID=185978 RepID=UPI001C121021|nr:MULTISPECIES: DUF2508 family protein [unclassified Paenibacillus]MBU5444483.1 YaaL family protein [Paenibacillus sp. MSJ-34]CAH0122723.1 hypothetical protein PAE9249_05312 [Paenibacillus sp. CECT 9249]
MWLKTFASKFGKKKAEKRRRRPKRRRMGTPEYEAKLQLYEDIRNAHRQWEQAYFVFHEALGDDQVDYAIYMLEAAEKKYEILLKKAKVEKLSVLSI